MSEERKQLIVMTILAGTVLAEAHGIKVVAKEPVEVEFETDSYDMAAEVLVGSGRQDLLPRLEHVEVIEDAELGKRAVTVRYNPIGTRMIQEEEHAIAEQEAIARNEAEAAGEAAGEPSGEPAGSGEPVPPVSEVVS
jgi:hypothetical protein